MEKDIQSNDTAVRKVSEKRKASNQKWDLENMRSISCRLRKEDAELFKEYCAENHTTPGAYLKNHIHTVLDKYCKDKEK
jgi:hypothetical protein